MLEVLTSRFVSSSFIGNLSSICVRSIFRSRSTMSGELPKKKAPYGSWVSPISSDMITAGNCQDLKELQLDNTDFGKGSVYWLEQIFEDGRGVVNSINLDVPLEERERLEWTAYPFSCRNEVHEYGGGSFVVHAGLNYFTTVNNIYRQERCDHIPDPFTPLYTVKECATANFFRFADATVTENNVYCVREDHHPVKNGERKEPINTLVRFNPSKCEVVVVGEVHEYHLPNMTVIAEGADFYASPKVSRDGKRLVWMQWDHPNMPWDGTDIWIADVDETGDVSGQRKLLGDGKTNFMQPRWANDGSLFVLADVSNWWNIYKVDIDNGKLGENVYPIDKDLGGPMWNLGKKDYEIDGNKDETTIAFTLPYKIIVKNIISGDFVEYKTGYKYHDYVSIGNDEMIYCIARSPEKPAAVIRLNPSTKAVEVVREVRDSKELDSKFISIPEELSFKTGKNGSEESSGFYYPPTNGDFEAQSDGDLPPVIIKAHGGPTGATRDVFAITYQYYTSRGFAIFDVNYRGSTGQGRRYRDRLQGEWGVIDLEDVCNAAKFLVSSGRADPNKLCIEGGSAGGYLVLRAISVPDLFKAAVSRYGISDLEALHQETHKFESNYDTRLIGPYDSCAQMYKDRSPINHLDEICCAVAFFQGLDDKVVPPNQAEAMHEAVKNKGLATTLVTFEKEGHGFRRKENIALALDGSYSFFCHVLGIVPSCAAIPIDQMFIHNLKPTARA